MFLSTQGPSLQRTLLLGASLAVTFALVAASAQAQTARYSLSGNTRSQIGAGLPLPITFQPAPNGKVVLDADSYVFQTAGPDPKAMTLVKTPSPIFGPVTTTAFVGQFNPSVMQVKTSLVVNGPAGTAGTAMFSAGGRTGPAIFTWCPGLPLPTATFNPSCTAPTNATLPTPTGFGASMNASIRYEATSNQFGGTSQAEVAGGASVVIRADAAMPLPCKHPDVGGAQSSCVAAFSLVAVNPTAAFGGPIGFSNMTTPALSPSNVFFVGATTNGAVTAVGAQQPISFPKNDVTSYGGPWTTGKVTIRAPLAAGSPETFFLEGSDNRVNGVGSISLVSGALSKRSLSGDNANRGWLNYEVAPFSVPSISNGGLILLGAIFLAATLWMVRRSLASSH